MDALGDGGFVRRLRSQKNMAAASTATSRQPPTARPIARSWVAPESLVSEAGPGVLGCPGVARGRGVRSGDGAGGAGEGDGGAGEGEGGAGEGEGGGGEGDCGGGLGDGGGGLGDGVGGEGEGGGGGGEGARRVTWT